MPRAGFYQIENSTIRFGRDGRWYADGEPIENQRIADLFSRHVERSPNGTYCLRIGPEQAPIQVDDTPYVIVSTSEGPSGITVTLNDGSTEPLDCSALEVGEGQVLYCPVKEGRERARFLRPAYYQVARHIIETSPGRYACRHGGTTYPIRRRQT